MDWSRAYDREEERQKRKSTDNVCREIMRVLNSKIETKKEELHFNATGCVAVDYRELADDMALLSRH